MKKLKLRLWNGKDIINLFEPAIVIRENSLSVVFTNNFYDLWHSKHQLERGEISDCKLIEFTGLKDGLKNEIYDGDIIKVSEDYTHPSGRKIIKGNYKVQYCLDGFGFYREEGIWMLSDFAVNIFPDYGIIDSIEVIGNTYKNPELVK